MEAVGDFDVYPSPPPSQCACGGVQTRLVIELFVTDEWLHGYPVHLCVSLFVHFGTGIQLQR